MNNRILLFDIDGTLTLPREKISNETKEALRSMKSKSFQVCVVGGGTYAHIKDQLEDFTDELDYVFSENGTRTFKNGIVTHETHLKDVLGDVALNEIIDFSLLYMSNIDLPFKRGTFFELRTGLVNICPMGRNCTYEERLVFADYDSKHNVLSTMRDILDEKFSKKYNLVFSLGSSISIDMFIEGYRKPFCLDFIKNNEILFFGDKTSPGGNDYEISIDPRVKKSFTVKNPEETVTILNSIEEYFK